MLLNNQIVMHKYRVMAKVSTSNMTENLKKLIAGTEVFDESLVCPRTPIEVTAQDIHFNIAKGHMKFYSDKFVEFSS
jgi:hypothetical protein